MDRFKNILFFADGAKGEKSALIGAMELAQHNNARLTILAVVPEVSTNDERLSPSIKKLQTALIYERRETIDQLLSGTLPETDAPKVETLVKAGEKDFIEVIKTVTDGKYDLLVKSVDPAGALSHALFGNHDLRLLRQCPCPVWIIKPTRRKNIRTILAAVDLTKQEDSSLRLASRIVGIASGVAAKEGARLHILTAWDQPVDASIKKRMEVEAYEEFTNHYKDQIRRRFEKLVANNRHKATEDHIIRGNPEKAITRFVSDYDVDLLVMGTLSRSGIPGLLIGNTAERVLNQVNCSVLTMKPEGFTATIK
ncbi:MAG: universal stress protein [Pseudomonadales bacterium]